jgi:hypothetical protein
MVAHTYRPHGVGVRTAGLAPSFAKLPMAVRC